MKTCPHCHAETFGTSQLLTLDYFSAHECPDCHQLVRNDGLRQLLLIPTILAALAAGVVLFSVVPDLLQPFAIIIAFLLAFLALTLLAKPVKFEDEVILPSFSPDPDNDKVIIVCGWDEAELQEILSGFVERYTSGWPPYRFEVSRKDEDCFRLTFPEDIHPVLFAFLINYAMYPIDVGRPAGNVRVAGQVTLAESFDGIPKELFGQKAVLYNPENGDVFDVVHLRSGTGITFANSLGENDWRKIVEARAASQELFDPFRLGGSI